MENRKQARFLSVKPARLRGRDFSFFFSILTLNC